MGREPELDVDEPACDHRWWADLGHHMHLCLLVSGHDGDHECGLSNCRAKP